MQPGGALEPLPSCGAHVWGLTTTLKPPSRSPRSPRAKVLKPLMSLAAVGEPGTPRFFLPGLQTFEYISVIYMIIERRIIWNVFVSGKSVYISFTPNVCFSSSCCLICNKNNLAFWEYKFYSCFWLTLKQCLGRKCSGVIHRQCVIPYKTFWLHRMRSRGCVSGLCEKLYAHSPLLQMLPYSLPHESLGYPSACAGRWCHRLLEVSICTALHFP